MKTTLLEGLDERRKQFENLNAALKPDILILIEVAGLEEAKNVASAMGWTDYHGVVSNFKRVEDSAYFALEVAVLSKVKIKNAVEFDPLIAVDDDPDDDRDVQDGVHKAFGGGTFQATLPSVSETQIVNTLLPTLGAFTDGDRGTMRVDLENGLTIFPVHLKSNSNGPCIDLEKAAEAIGTHDQDLAARLELFFLKGFRKATDEHIENARKRERMIAAVVAEANKAVTVDQRTVLIAGDFNTAFEDGKFGVKLNSDCRLKDYSCEEAPFPKKACQGDGFDDTLSIMELGLVGQKSWTFLSRELPRTYKNAAFSDLAIDHMAVPTEQVMHFSTAGRHERDLFRSDHYAIFTEYRPR